MTKLGRSWDELSIEERAQIRAAFPRWKLEDLAALRWERIKGEWRNFDYDALSKVFSLKH